MLAKKATQTLLLAILTCLGLACTARDFLTRRLAADLISASEAFKEPQLFWLRTGIVSNKDFSSPESLVLQRRGWIAANQQKCPDGVDPAPCWDVVLTPLGAETVKPLISSPLPSNGPIAIEVARRELVNISGISKAGNFADVEFIWRWFPSNPVGIALYDSGVHYRSTVAFRGYDDGWRLLEQPVPSNQPLEDALRNAQPTAP
ncbi:MAG: hypothetical protein WAK29_14120 [Terriglobales bacterium]